MFMNNARLEHEAKEEIDDSGDNEFKMSEVEVPNFARKPYAVSESFYSEVSPKTDGIWMTSDDVDSLDTRDGSGRMGCPERVRVLDSIRVVSCLYVPLILRSLTHSSILFFVLQQCLLKTREDVVLPLNLLCFLFPQSLRPPPWFPLTPVNPFLMR
jgi:hypothetical protein